MLWDFSLIPGLGHNRFFLNVTTSQIFNFYHKVKAFTLKSQEIQIWPPGLELDTPRLTIRSIKLIIREHIYGTELQEPGWLFWRCGLFSLFKHAEEQLQHNQRPQSCTPELQDCRHGGQVQTFITAHLRADSGTEQRRGRSVLAPVRGTPLYGFIGYRGQHLLLTWCNAHM